MTTLPTPDPLAGLPDSLATPMRRRGFTELTPVQQCVLDTASEGRDLRISSQTGSGKTVALGIALAREFAAAPAEPRRTTLRTGPSALVIVPTRELAAQVRDELAWLYAELSGMRVTVVTGGTALGPERRNLSARPALVVGTPGRMLDHIRSGALRCANVRHVVLDEADQMFDMGFREELEAIIEALPEERRSHLVSATFPTGLRHLADRFQKDPLHVQGTRPGAANADITHIAHRVRPNERYSALANLLLLSRGSRCLVFVQRRIDASALAERLAADGFAALPFSGELPQAQRTRTLNAFRQGSIDALISTDVAARGIDVPGISTVIHMDPPDGPEAYVHRSGRTGRAGLEGRSVLLVPSHAQRYVQRILNLARVRVDWHPAPDAKKVRKALARRARRALSDALDADPAPDEKRLAQAAELLEGREPTEVLARLLELTAPKPPCEPKELSAPDAAGPPRPIRPASPQRRRGTQDFVRFSVNWGDQRGATPSRILSHACRRGGIRSQQVGAIRIERDTSSIEIAANVSCEFEQKTRRPDTRDPGIVITRAADSRGPENGPRERTGKRRYVRPVESERGNAHDTRPRAPRPKPHPGRTDERTAAR